MFLALLLVFLLPTVGSAGPDTTVYVLPDLTVTATRLEASAFETTARVDIIDRAVLERTASRSLADALQSSTGVFIRRYGRGGLASISLRGTGASQTSILIDGRPVTDPQLGQIDLSLLPSALIDRVEVMSGAASPLYGGDGIGGAVNLRTLAPDEGFRSRVSGGVGAFGSREATLSVESRRGRTAFLLLGDLDRAQNDYTYFSRALARQVELRNADRNRASLFGTGELGLGAARIRASAMFVDGERGLPASASAASSGERQWDRSTRVWTDVEAGGFSFGAALQHGRIRYANPQLDLDETGLTRVASLDGRYRLGLYDAWTLVAGGELADATVDHPAIAEGAREQRAAAFAMLSGDVDGVMVNAALRADSYFRRRPDVSAIAAVSPRIGISTPVAERLRLRASVGRGFRTPTFNDRYWRPGGNPDLEPEVGWTVDGGAVYRSGPLRADLTLFHVATDNQIVWIPLTSGLWSPTNIASAVSRGFEAGVSAAGELGGMGMEGRLNYTFTDSRDRSDPASPTFDQPLRYVPREVLRAGGSVQRGKAELGLTADYTGRRYVSTDGSSWLDPFITVSLRLALHQTIAGSRVQTALFVDNLFDADYQVVANDPMPPRHLRFSITIDTSTR